jgi:uncharacterized protein YkwD
MSVYSSVLHCRDASWSRRAVRALLAVTLTVLMAIAATCAARPASAATTPAQTGTERTIAVAVQTVLNAERAAHHLPRLSLNHNLNMSARRHDVTMARYNTMSHQLPGEPFFATRMQQAGYHWTYAGENIAWNSSMTLAGVIALQKIMYNERPPNDGHRLNILSSHYREVGIDVYLDRRHHKVWMTTDFGRR